MRMRTGCPRFIASATRRCVPNRCRTMCPDEDDAAGFRNNPLSRRRVPHNYAAIMATASQAGGYLRFCAPNCDDRRKWAVPPRRSQQSAREGGDPSSSSNEDLGGRRCMPLQRRRSTTTTREPNASRAANAAAVIGRLRRTAQNVQSTEAIRGVSRPRSTVEYDVRDPVPRHFWIPSRSMITRRSTAQHWFAVSANVRGARSGVVATSERSTAPCAGADPVTAA